MTRKQAIKEFKRKGMIIPESAVELAISDMEKIEKLKTMLVYNDAISRSRPYHVLEMVKEILEKE